MNSIPNDEKLIKIPISLINDKNLNASTIALLIYLLSFGNEYEFIKSDIYEFFKGRKGWGRTCFDNRIKEAIRYGYIIQKQKKNGNLLRLKYKLNMKENEND